MCTTVSSCKACLILAISWISHDKDTRPVASTTSATNSLSNVFTVKSASCYHRYAPSLLWSTPWYTVFSILPNMVREFTQTANNLLSQQPISCKCNTPVLHVSNFSIEKDLKNLSEINKVSWTLTDCGFMRLVP